jgi:hypothetical protein
MTVRMRGANRHPERRALTIAAVTQFGPKPKHSEHDEGRRSNVCQCCLGRLDPWRDDDQPGNGPEPIAIRSTEPQSRLARVSSPHGRPVTGARPGSSVTKRASSCRLSRTMLGYPSAGRRTADRRWEANQSLSLR